MDNCYNPSDDVVRELEKENRDRKSTARSARNRVSGSKSKHCSLPCDSLTPSQLKALNGPVEEYNLKAPLNWAAFSSMPDDLCVEYLRQLKALYSPNDAMLADMFGVTRTTVYLKRKALGVPSPGKGYRPRNGCLSAWNDFLHPEAKEPCEAPGEESTVSPLPDDSEAPEPSESPRENTSDRRLSSFCVTFEDVRSWEELYALMTDSPAPGPGSKLSLCVNRERE